MRKSMSKMLKNRAKKFGMPPGSLVHAGETRVENVNLSVYDFQCDQLVEKENATVEECLTYIDGPSVTWINIQGIRDPKMMEALGKHFGLHPLVQEDILHVGQRSKLDDYKNTLFLVMRIFFYNAAEHTVEDEQVSLILGSNYVLSFVEGRRDIFDVIRDRARSPHSRMRSSGADYLFYALIDCIVDHHYVVLEKIENLVDTIDDEVFNHPNPKTMHKIQKLKRQITTLRKGVWPLREVISQLRRTDSDLIAESTKVFLHDVYDHTIQAIETIENFRDIVSGMLEVYLSNISNRMNEIMKVLTVVSTTFVPLTFIASIYGMNFEFMPELHAPYGYFYVLGLMLVVFSFMLHYFRRKKWI